MNTPKISVIVPVYNLAEYLEQSIDSLLCQTYKNLEIVLIDDGSDDASPEICDKLADTHDNIICIHQENLGVSVARNTGIKASTGEYIGFFDGDDLADADMYEFLYNLISKDNADIALCELRFKTADGSVKNVATGEYKSWDNAQDFLVDFFSGEIMMSADTKLFKREICEKIEFPVNYKTNEDKYYCFLAAINAEKISSKSEAKYTYCRREGSSSNTQFSDKYFDCIRLADKMLDEVSQSYPEIIDDAKCNKLATVLRIYKLLHTRNGYSSFKNEAKEMRAYVKSFDKATAKKLLSTNNYIRYRVLCLSQTLFLFMTKFFDRY